jgi:uroporphyrinogen III methyltransferase / synthase
LTADLIPEQFRAEALADCLSERVAGRRVLLVRASRGREVLAQQIVAAGGRVDQVVAYSSQDVQQVDPAIHKQLRQGQIDWITVTSSAIARSLVQLFGDDLSRTKLASISPITTSTLGELGCQVAAEANPYTMEGVVQAILNHARIDRQR